MGKDSRPDVSRSLGTGSALWVAISKREWLKRTVVVRSSVSMELQSKREAMVAVVQVEDIIGVNGSDIDRVAVALGAARDPGTFLERLEFAAGEAEARGQRPVAAAGEEPHHRADRVGPLVRAPSAARAGSRCGRSRRS